MANKTLLNFNYTTRLHDTDAAGIVFFARLFYIAHDAFEELLKNQDLSIKQLIDKNILLPIKSSNADFKAPIELNEELTITIIATEIKDNEFSLAYQFEDKSDRIRARVTTQHICLDKLTNQRTAIPEWLLKLLK